MIKAGTENTEILNQYISDIDCWNCKKEADHLLIVYCKTFVFGPWFWPIKWWSWKKNGKMRCTNCNHVSTVDKNNYNLPPKVLNYYNHQKVPFIYKVPTLLFIFSIVTVVCLFALGFFAALIYMIQPIESKLSGEWTNQDSTYRLHIYKDKNYTLIRQDTVVFSSYKTSDNELIFNFLNRENIIQKNKINPLILLNSNNETFTFTPTNGSTNEDYMKEKNLWRIKPSRPENNQQIRNRVIGYFNFEKHKFEKAIEEGTDLIDNDVYAPIVFAVNGIGIRESSLEKWKPIFYDENDWQKANLIIRNEFPNEFMIDENEKNSFKTNLDIVKLYIKKIQNSKLDYLTY